MRIVIIGYSNDIHVVRWCNALSRRNLEVHLVTIHTPNGKNPIQKDVTVHVLPHHGGLGYLTGVPALKEKIKKINPDIINTHYAEGYGTMARLAGVKPNILSVYGHDVFEAPYRNRLYHYLITANLRKATHIASTSNVMKAQVHKLYPEAAVSVTPFGVDMTLFTPRDETNAMNAADHTLSNRSFTFGTVKKLDKKYGIDTLITAFHRLTEMLPNAPIRLDITGDGPLREELQELVQTLHLTDTVTLYPAVPHKEVPAQLHQLDVYIAASRSHGESFGVAVIEAMACGIPVIVANVGGLPEVTENGQFGLLVPAEDSDALARAMYELYTNTAKRKALATSGRAHVHHTYSWDRCVDTMIAVYENVRDAHD